ncbi:MAG: 50S ribosomal protein L10 [bacterium]|nr:50S ribosomal protein L10 [bacterium]
MAGKGIQKKSSKGKKEVSLSELRDKIKRSKSIVMTNYRGLTMVKLQELRSALGEKGEYTIAKNTLLAKALNESGMNDINPDTFAGPTAVLFSYDDEVGPLKILTKFSINSNSLPEIKCGILENVLLPADRVVSLSKLASKEQLRGQVVFGLAAPLTGLVTVLNGNIRNLVYALNQIKEQKTV